MKKLATVLFSVSWLLGYSQQITKVGSGISGSYIHDLIFFDGQLYAGGYFTSGTQPKNHVLRFDGAQWQTLDNGVNGAGFPYVKTFCAYDNKLYMGGAFSLAGTFATTDLGIWNGTGWEEPAGGIDNVNVLFKFGTDLYAGTTTLLTNGGTKAFIWKWDGAQWQNLADSFTVEPNENFDIQGIHAATIYRGRLIVAGLFKSIGGQVVNNIALWDGGKWAALGNGTNGYVHALQVWRDTLYAGGSFDSAGTVPANNMAQWDGSAWKGLDPQIDQRIEGFGVYADELWIGGQFFTPNRGVLKYDGNKFTIPFTPDNGVKAFLNDGNSLIFAGSFKQVDGQPISLIGRYKKNGLGVQTPACRGLQLYPNPAGSQLFINLQNSGSGEVKIYDVTGRQVYGQSFAGQGTIAIQTQLFTVGVYRVVVIEGDGTATGTFVKE